jgi:leucyl aminopeptidase
MQVTLEPSPIQDLVVDALIVPAFEKEDVFPPAVEAINERTGGWVQEVYNSGEFKGKPFESAILHRPANFKAKRLVLFGAGKREKFDAAEARKLAGAAVRALKSKGVRSIALSLAQPSGDLVAAVAEGAWLGDWEPDRYKTRKENGETPLDSFAVAVASGGPGLSAALDRARLIAEAQNFARDLANEPANKLTPMILADRARAMAAEVGLEFELLDQDRMRQLGMGALLGVAQGSAEPPALIILRYRPQKLADGAPHLGLIGKGVTFDTGGISIKPSDNMDKMKYDMAGAASVIGAMRAIAQLKPSIPVTALAPAVENMPGSRAQRPGDIVTTLSGKTVEVLNTDAEGRLILADALAYARRIGCTHLVNAATLTGAIVVALGHVNTGVFTNDEALQAKVLDAAKAEGEKMWPMPLDEEYKEQLKTPFADMPNIGTRWGGAITAAMFLKEFVEDTPWVHLDIAGTAWLEETKPYLAKGPSGSPVRTFIRLATAW